MTTIRASLRSFVFGGLLFALVSPNQASAQATDVARTYLDRAFEACDSIVLGGVTFEQARTALGLAAPGADGVSKGLRGTRRKPC